MTNPVFDNAITSVAQALAAVEAEIGRMSGVYQQTEAMRVQQRDLQKTVNDLARQVAEARRVLSDAEVAKNSIVEEGRKEKARMIASADHQASVIVEAANKNADEIIANAHEEIATERKTLADLKDQVRFEQSQLETMQRKVDTTTAQFAQMKRQHAAAMAALE